MSFDKREEPEGAILSSLLQTRRFAKKLILPAVLSATVATVVTFPGCGDRDEPKEYTSGEKNKASEVQTDAAPPPELPTDAAPPPDLEEVDYPPI